MDIRQDKGKMENEQNSLEPEPHSLRLGYGLFKNRGRYEYFKKDIRRYPKISTKQETGSSGMMYLPFLIFQGIPGENGKYLILIFAALPISFDHHIIWAF